MDILGKLLARSRVFGEIYDFAEVILISYLKLIH